MDSEIKLVQIGNKEGQLVRINAKYGEDLKTSLIAYLRRIKDIFAWVP